MELDYNAYLKLLSLYRMIGFLVHSENVSMYFYYDDFLPNPQIK